MLRDKSKSLGSLPTRFIVFLLMVFLIFPKTRECGSLVGLDGNWHSHLYDEKRSSQC